MFKDRQEAGRKLSKMLASYAGRQDVIVLALPRGGVPVGLEVARALHVPLDLMIVRKLGVPGHEELAMGAIASGGARYLNRRLVLSLRISQEKLDAVTAREEDELRRRELLYRGERPPPQVHDQTVILVDDGVATGATMHAAVAALRQLEPARVIVAVPTAAPDAAEALRAKADEIVCVETPEPYIAVGAWYRFFPQVGDAEVRGMLEAVAGRAP